MNYFEKLKQLVMGREKDAYADYLMGNTAASMHLRKKLQRIKMISHAARAEVIA